MTRQLSRQRPTRRAPMDVEQDDYDYDDPPWDEPDDEPRVDRDRGRRGRDAVESRDSRRPGRRSERDDDRPSRRPVRDDSDRSESRRSRRADEDRPSRSRRPDREEAEVSRGAGWGTLKDQRAKKVAGSAHRLQVKEKEVVIHFLEEEPFAVYEQHWINNRSYTCPDENGCPACDDGYDTRTLALFNVVDMKSGESMYWEAGPNAAKKIIAASEKKSSSPINRDDLYFAVNRVKQSNNFYDYDLDSIKERDLSDEYEVEPLSDEELADALDKLFDSSVIPRTSRRDLQNIVDGGDDDD